MLKVKYNNKDIDIYEHQDAEMLIKTLSVMCAGDCTTVARGGRGRNKVTYYNYPCAFDIETTTIKAGELDYVVGEDAPPVAFPYLFQWCVYGKVIMCRHYHEAIDVFKWLSEYFKTALNKRLIFFIHNANYEYTFFKDLWKIEPKYSFALDEHHPVTITTTDGFMFRDSYKMTNMSLDTLTKDWSKVYKKMPEIMDYSKLRTPYTPLDGNTILYSALDVLSLSESIKNYLDARNEPIWTACPTSTSFIRKNLKRTVGINVKVKTDEQIEYKRILEKQSITPDIYQLLKRCARGGNTHANRKITGVYFPEPSVVHFDICSSYPTQMICYKYPVGRWRKLDAGSYIEDIEALEQYDQCTIFDMVLINPRLKPNVAVPYISISKMVILKGDNMQATDNGRYMGGLEQIQISIFGCELPIIKAQYDFDDAIITHGYFAYKDYLPDIFRRFILNLYEQKTTLKNVESKAIEYAIAKAELNGCFGMCMTDIKHLKYEFEDNNIILADESDFEKYLNRYQKSQSFFVVYAWGCLTACYGRVYLQKMIDACMNADGTSDFLYCDTDSIFATNPERTRKKIKALEKEITEEQRKCGMPLVYYDIKGKPHELGTIDEETPCGFKTFGAKKYITVENGKLKCTVAGVPKKRGAEVIKTPDNFKIGLNFRGENTGKLCVWYNDKPDFELHDQGRLIEMYSNVAMLPCDYLLSLSKDYMECLSIEGNFHWLFSEAERNVLNEDN